MKTMTKEQKELLIKDLCGRLPYGVKGTNAHGMIVDLDYPTDYSPYMSIKNAVLKHDWKPYLFPMSSMIEEQKKEISKRYNLHTSYGLCIEITNHSEGYWDDDNSCHLQDYLWLVDWLNKNHFDYRGLISMGLAIDATNLNIY